MGQYTKELAERLRDGREAKVSPQARAIRKAASKREREAEQAKALTKNSRREFIHARKSKYMPHIGKKESARHQPARP